MAGGLLTIRCILYIVEEFIMESAVFSKMFYLFLKTFLLSVCTYVHECWPPHTCTLFKDNLQQLVLISHLVGSGD